MTDYRTKVVQKVLGHLIILIIGVIFDLATLGRLLEKIDNFIIQYMVTLALNFKGMYQRNIHCVVITNLSSIRIEYSLDTCAYFPGISTQLVILLPSPNK